MLRLITDKQLRQKLGGCSEMTIWRLRQLPTPRITVCSSRNRAQFFSRENMGSPSRGCCVYLTSADGAGPPPTTSTFSGARVSMCRSRCGKAMGMPASANRR